MSLRLPLLLAPLLALSAHPAAQEEPSRATIRWQDDLDLAVELARDEDRPLMIVFR